MTTGRYLKVPYVDRAGKPHAQGDDVSSLSKSELADLDVGAALTATKPAAKPNSGKTDVPVKATGSRDRSTR